MRLFIHQRRFMEDIINEYSANSDGLDFESSTFNSYADVGDISNKWYPTENDNPEISYNQILQFQTPKSSRIPIPVIFMIVAIFLVLSPFIGSGIIKCFVILKEFIWAKNISMDEFPQTGFEPTTHIQPCEVRRFNAVTEFASANANPKIQLPPSYNEVMEIDSNSALPPTYLESLKIDIDNTYSQVSIISADTIIITV